MWVCMMNKLVKEWANECLPIIKTPPYFIHGHSSAFQVLNYILYSPYNSSKMIPLHDDTLWWSFGSYLEPYSNQHLILVSHQKLSSQENMDWCSSKWIIHVVCSENTEQFSQSHKSWRDKEYPEPAIRQRLNIRIIYPTSMWYSIVLSLLLTTGKKISHTHTILS